MVLGLRSGEIIGPRCSLGIRHDSDVSGRKDLSGEWIEDGEERVPRRKKDPMVRQKEVAAGYKGLGEVN